MAEPPRAAELGPGRPALPCQCPPPWGKGAGLSLLPAASTPGQPRPGRGATVAATVCPRHGVMTRAPRLRGLPHPRPRPGKRNTSDRSQLRAVLRSPWPGFPGTDQVVNTRESLRLRPRPERLPAVWVRGGP